MVVVAAILYATLNSDPVGADDLPQIPHHNVRRTVFRHYV